MKKITSILSTFIPFLFVLMWSSGYMFVKLGIQYNTVVIFLFLRLLMATIIIFLISQFWIKPDWPKMSKNWFAIVGTGLLIQGAYSLFFFEALEQDISPSVLTIVLGLQPILTALITSEAKNNHQWVSLIFGMIGLCLVVGNNMFLGEISSFGLILAFLSLVSITLGTIMQKRCCSHVQIIPNMCIQYAVATMFIGLLCLFSTTHPIVWTVQFLISLTYLGLIISVGATLLLYWLLKSNNSTKVSQYFYCVPPVTALMDFFIFHKSLTGISLFGMVLVMGSVFFA